MKAMIFAAGMGTRLRPLTDETPKALIKVGGATLLEWVLRKMAFYHIRDIVVNVHHLSGQVVSFLQTNPVPGLNISISDESDFLLDTGGGLKKAAGLLRGTEPVLLHNVDVLSDLNFSDFERAFLDSPAMAMLAVKERKASRLLEFDLQHHLIGWVNEQTGETKEVNRLFGTGHRRAFSGISIIRPTLPDMLTGHGAFGLIPALLLLARTNNVMAYSEPHKWLDVGKPDSLKKAENHIADYYYKYRI